MPLFNGVIVGECGESNDIGMIGLLELRRWTMGLSVGLFWLMEEYDVHSVQGLLSLEPANVLNFGD